MTDFERDYMEGLRLFYLQRYDEAAELLTRTAEAGDPKSQHFLAMMYENGNGVERDLATAAYWYRKTAEHGDREAELTYSVLLALGKGVDADIPEACRWAVRALHHGNDKALQSLQLIRPRVAAVAAEAIEAFKAAHLAGDDVLAATHLERAAVCGDMDAQFAFAQLLLRGVGIAEDRAEALLWLRDAAEAGHGEAAALLAELTAAPEDDAQGEAPVA